MKLLQNPTIFFGTFVLMTFCVLSWSCKKEDQTCTAIVTATDINGAALAGATVHLRPNVTPTGGQTINVDETQTTDGSGKATFTFKLQSILNCTVTAIGGATGTGIVKLEPAKTIEKTIIAQ